ncbi:MAG: hypothetical protein H6553_09170 [Chitinophagales bacterium]|nr:hypothetical protein [Chitinophagales bacterium]
MKKLLIYIIVLICFSFQLANAQEVLTDKEKVMVARIDCLNNMKQFAGNLYWKDFGKSNFVGTIVYITDSASYFFNPEALIMERIHNYAPIDASEDYSLLKLAPFKTPIAIIETMFEPEFGDESQIYYKLPVLFASSPELYQRLNINEFNNTDEWLVSAFHEYYHQYQYKNIAILDYITSLLKQKKLLTMDSLSSIYHNNIAFKDSLDKENQLLLKAIQSTNKEVEKKYFAEFLKVRNERRKQYIKQTKFPINLPEDFWEKLEGATYYQEAILKHNYNAFKGDSTLLKIDNNYTGGTSFSSFNMNSDPKYSDTNEAFYYVGAIGFNLIRLLEKNKVNYKDNLYKFASQPLHTLLKYHYKIK